MVTLSRSASVGFKLSGSFLDGSRAITTSDPIHSRAPATFYLGTTWAYPASHETVVSVSDNCAPWVGGIGLPRRIEFSVNIADMWSKDNQAKNTQRDVGKIPDGNAIPKEILRLRHKHQLRPLTEREDGRKIKNCRMEYTVSQCAARRLRATRGNTFSLEIQKHDGIIYYVGYATDEDIEKISDSSKKLSYPHVP